MGFSLLNLPEVGPQEATPISGLDHDRGIQIRSSSENNSAIDPKGKGAGAVQVPMEKRTIPEPGSYSA